MPSKVGVLESIIFSHTPDEAMSVGLAKACVPWKIYSVLEKLSFLNDNINPHEIIPISFNMQNVLHAIYYNIDENSWKDI